jgi:hypothetical protein
VREIDDCLWICHVDALLFELTDMQKAGQQIKYGKCIPKQLYMPNRTLLSHYFVRRTIRCGGSTTLVRNYDFCLAVMLRPHLPCRRHGVLAGILPRFFYLGQDLF